MDGSPVRSVEIFCTRKNADEAIVTRVGSSSPDTSGSAVPLTFGSSLSAKVEPFESRSRDWLVTTVPFESVAARRTSNWIRTSPPSGMLKLRMSRIPPPFAPPLGFVLLTSAPAGYATSASEPGTNVAVGLSASSTSRMRNPLIAWSKDRKRRVYRSVSPGAAVAAGFAPLVRSATVFSKK